MGDLNLYLDQLYTFLCFLITGFLIGILFDIFRILRKSFKVPDIITYMQDIVFWILTGALLLYSIFTFNNGELRSYVFIGIILGTFFYILLFSKYIIKFTTKLINILKGTIGYPIKKVFNFLKKKIIKPLYDVINKFYKKIKFKMKKLNSINMKSKE